MSAKIYLWMKYLTKKSNYSVGIKKLKPCSAAFNIKKNTCAKMYRVLHLTIFNVGILST